MLLSVVRIVSAGLMVLSACAVSGQEYPHKPIRIVCGAVGSGNDFVARLIAQEISGPLGQQMIVDNRPAGVIPGQIVTRAPADGYTLLIMGGTFLIGPLLQATPYDVVKDFSPITQVERSPLILVVNPLLPVNSVKELIALAKAKPGALNYGMTAPGGSTHLTAELFNSMAGVNIVRVSFRGTDTSIASLIAGETQLQFASTTSVMAHYKSGRLRALAVTSATPSVLVPGLPTVAASGLPGYESAGMTAVFAPAKTPATIVNRLNREIVRAMNQADVKEKFLDAGLEAVSSSPEQTAATVKAEIAKWGKVIKDAGIKVD